MLNNKQFLDKTLCSWLPIIWRLAKECDFGYPTIEEITKCK
jgi:hypothetical protein